MGQLLGGPEILAIESRPNASAGLSLSPTRKGNVDGKKIFQKSARKRDRSRLQVMVRWLVNE
jgi:hypothetical protein